MDLALQRHQVPLWVALVADFQDVFGHACCLVTPVERVEAYPQVRPCPHSQNQTLGGTQKYMRDERRADLREVPLGMYENSTFLALTRSTIIDRQAITTETKAQVSAAVHLAWPSPHTHTIIGSISLLFRSMTLEITLNATKLSFVNT